MIRAVKSAAGKSSRYARTSSAPTASMAREISPRLRRRRIHELHHVVSFGPCPQRLLVATVRLHPFRKRMPARLAKQSLVIRRLPTSAAVFHPHTSSPNKPTYEVDDCPPNITEVWSQIRRKGPVTRKRKLRQLYLPAGLDRAGACAYGPAQGLAEPTEFGLAGGPASPGGGDPP